MEPRKALDAHASSIMLVLCMTWGLQQVLIKATAADMAPILQIGLRSGVAALLVGLLMLWQRQPGLDWAGTWRPGLVAGGLFSFEYLLVGEGMRFTTASHMAVFLYTAPIFVALGLHWRFPSERLSPVKWLGIGVAFTGIVVTFLGRGAPAVGGGQNMLLGDLMGLVAGASWGATTVVLRSTRLSQAPAAQTLLYQLLVACVSLVLAAALLGQTAVNPTPLLWGSLAFQAVGVSFVSFLVWFWLLRRYLASPLSVFSFLTPLFGMGFGVWLLNEPLEPSFVAGAVLVLAGVLLVSSDGLLQQFRQRAG